MLSFFSSPWPYANLEKGYDLVTGQQAPERIFRWVLHFWYVSRVHDSADHLCLRRHTGDDGGVPLHVCACLWQSMQMGSRYTLTQLDGLTHAQPVLRWKCYPWALMWRNRPKGSLGWTPFKCFYCHFFSLLHSWWGHCVWHLFFQRCARLKGGVQYRPAVMLESFYNALLFFYVFGFICWFVCPFVGWFALHFGADPDQSNIKALYFIVTCVARIKTYTQIQIMVVKFNNE